MTDLEKLAADMGEEEAIETVLRLGAVYGYGNMINRLQEAWQGKLQMGMSEEAARLSSFDCLAWERKGRIEGLKEAARNICLLCRKGKAVSIDHLHPIIILATGEVHYEFCQAAEIHARIQELEGEK